MGVHYHKRNTVTNSAKIRVDANNKLSYIGSGTSFKNLTNTSQTGSLNNGVAFTNGMFDFDGVDDFAELDSAVSKIQTDTIGSIEFWVNLPDASPTGGGYICGFSKGSTFEYVLVFLSATNRLNVFTAVAGVGKMTLVATNPTFVDNTNHHVVITSDGVDTKMIVDKIEIPQSYTLSTDTAVWFNDITVDAIRIGCRRAGGTNNGFLNFLVTEITVYDAVLSTAQIEQNYNSQKTRFL